MAKAQNICFEDCDHVTSEQINKREKKRSDLVFGNRLRGCWIIVRYVFSKRKRKMYEKGGVKPKKFLIEIRNN